MSVPALKDAMPPLQGLWNQRREIPEPRLQAWVEEIARQGAQANSADRPDVSGSASLVLKAIDKQSSVFGRAARRRRAVDCGSRAAAFVVRSDGAGG